MVEFQAFCQLQRDNHGTVRGQLGCRFHIDQAIGSIAQERAQALGFVLPWHHDGRKPVVFLCVRNGFAQCGGVFVVVAVAIDAHGFACALHRRDFRALLGRQKTCENLGDFRRGAVARKQAAG